jgi:predicted transcriptional regulator of viral defense system
MKLIPFLQQLRQRPVFTENDIAKILNKGAAYVRILLHRLHVQGYIHRLERGKYTLYEDPLIYASHLITPSYFSLWTGLRYHNLTTQQPQNIFVLCSRPKKSIKVGRTKVIFTQSKHLFGYKKERYADFDIFVAEPEKAIIDSLLFRIPLEYVIEALEAPGEKINYPQLAKYAQRTGNKSLIKRLGYLLEKITGQTYGLAPLDYNYVALDYNGRRKGIKHKKWRVIINHDY